MANGSGSRNPPNPRPPTSLIDSRQALLAASSAEETLHGDVEAASEQYAQLRQELVDKDKYFQVLQLVQHPPHPFFLHVTTEGC